MQIFFAKITVNEIRLQYAEFNPYHRKLHYDRNRYRVRWSVNCVALMTVVTLLFTRLGLRFRFRLRLRLRLKLRLRLGLRQ